MSTHTNRYVLIGILLSANLLGAQAPDDSLISLESLKADVYFLAAPEMAGRETASVEGLIATNYIAAELMRLGLEPIDGDSYFQNFSMVRARLDREKTLLLARWGGVE